MSCLEFLLIRATCPRMPPPHLDPQSLVHALWFRSVLTEIKLCRQLGRKARLVLVSGVGPLLDLYHFDLLQDLKSVSASGQKNDIARLQNSTFQVALIVIEEINTQSPSLQEKNFKGILYVAVHRVVNVRLDNLSGRVVHVSELL